MKFLITFYVLCTVMFATMAVLNVFQAGDVAIWWSLGALYWAWDGNVEYKFALMSKQSKKWGR